MLLMHMAVGPSRSHSSLGFLDLDQREIPEILQLLFLTDMLERSGQRKPAVCQPPARPHPSVSSRLHAAVGRLDLLRLTAAV